MPRGVFGQGSMLSAAKMRRRPGQRWNDGQAVQSLAAAVVLQALDDLRLAELANVESWAEPLQFLVFDADPWLQLVGLDRERVLSNPKVIFGWRS